MKQEVGRLKERIAGGIKAKLDALSPEQRLHVVIGMFGILVVLFLYCIWQTVTDIADRKESTNIVIEHIDSPIIVDGKQDYSQLKDMVNGTGRKEPNEQREQSYMYELPSRERGRQSQGTGAVARQGLRQLIPGGAKD